MLDSDSDSSSDSVIVVYNKTDENIPEPPPSFSNSSFAVDHKDDVSESNTSTTSSISFNRWHTTLLAPQRRFEEEERLYESQRGRGRRAAGGAKGRGARRR